MTMNPELAEALASDPAFTAPLAPPEGIPLHEFAREQAKSILTPFVEYYGARLPSGACTDLCPLNC